jgi:LysR family glycine cleavage system transcriptional activator
MINTPAMRIPPVATLMAFEASGRLGSFSEAADQLGQTQSAVSQQIKKLEELVGQQLFFRKGTGVRLTAAGELLFQTVSSILGELTAGFDRIEPYKNQDSVLLVCPADFARGWLTARLGSLRRSHPTVEVWVITKREIREIDRIDVDLIVSRRPIHTADIECVPLMEDASIGVCARSFLAQYSKLGFHAIAERAPLLLLETEPEWGGLLREGRLRGRRLHRAATFDDAAALLDAVERGLGIGYVSRVMADSALRDGRVFALPAIPAASRPRFWLMRSRLKPRTPMADLAFGWLQAAAAGRGDS